MPQGSTSAARIISDNLDYRERGGLRLADALRIHAALHDPNAPSVTISTGHVLPIDSGGETGVRRCHVVVDAERPRGRWVTLSNALSWQPPGSRRLRPCARGGLWPPREQSIRSPGPPWSEPPWSVSLFRPRVHRAKLMVQNPNKQSQPAKLAREQGARITHILPLDASGHHTLAADSGVWGCIGCNLC